MTNLEKSDLAYQILEKLSELTTNSSKLSRVIGRDRSSIARLMPEIYEADLVSRNVKSNTVEYSITDKGEEFVELYERKRETEHEIRDLL